MSLSPKHEEYAALPDHPYRDSAIFYGVLAAVVVVLSAISSTGLVKGAAIALAFWVAATGWSWWRFRVRIRRREDAAARAAAAERAAGEGAAAERAGVEGGDAGVR
jgi:hypothetical protein